VDVEVSPTKKIVVFGVDKRPLKDLAWCAITFDTNRLFWVDGHVLCVEVYEKAFEQELKKKEFPISQVCYASYPTYTRVFEVEKGMQIPVVNASDMRLYRSLLEAILKDEQPAPQAPE
jgi:hypothetical protein